MKIQKTKKKAIYKMTFTYFQFEFAKEFMRNFVYYMKNNEK